MARVWRRCAPKLSKLASVSGVSALLFGLSGAARAACVVGIVATSLSCVSPTLPLPPPAAPIISTGSEPDTFRLTSINGALPNALIVVVNRNEALARDKRVSGTIADANGSWDATVIAKVGDALDISQESGTTSSPPTTVTVR